MKEEEKKKAIIEAYDKMLKAIDECPVSNDILAKFKTSIDSIKENGACGIIIITL